MNDQKDIAILMADLTGYTAMTEIHGAESALNIVNKYLQLAKRSMYGTARLVERAGDQLVIISTEPYDIAITAIELIKHCVAEPEFLLVHAGIHYGTVIENEGSFFGSAMNLTARIAAQAEKGKVLCSKEFIDKVGATDAFHFVFPKELRLKNIMQPVVVSELVATENNHTWSMHIDPVCHMLVDTGGNYSYNHKGKHYHFCSEKCMNIFIENPF